MVRLSKGLPLSASDMKIWSRFVQGKTDGEVLVAISSTLAIYLSESQAVLQNTAHAIMLQVQTPFPAPRLKMPRKEAFSADSTDSLSARISPLQDLSSASDCITPRSFFCFGLNTRGSADTADGSSPSDSYAGASYRSPSRRYEKWMRADTTEPLLDTKFCSVLTAKPQQRGPGRSFHFLSTVAGASHCVQPASPGMK
jgi:hypothetical protein